MISYRELWKALHSLGLEGKPVIVHASLKAFGHIPGGAETVVHALLNTVGAILAPVFTYKTMVIPEVGPPNNGITYGSGGDLNKMAIPFTADLPADPLMGTLPEAVRLHRLARRSHHPILSFAGINADAILQTQTLFNPLAPIGALAKQDGWVLLMGVDHTVNTSIHYAEKLAGRKQFIRWALTPERIVECPGFPGDSSAFQEIAPELETASRWARAGKATIQAVPLKTLLSTVEKRIKEDPLALLCQREDCERCRDVRAVIHGR